MTSSNLPNTYDGLYRAALSQGLSVEQARRIVRTVAFDVDFRKVIKPDGCFNKESRCKEWGLAQSGPTSPEGAHWQPWKVASPLKKQRFNLSTGVCMEDERFNVKSFKARVVKGAVEVSA